jgi:hypothetical protein
MWLTARLRAPRPVPRRARDGPQPGGGRPGWSPRAAPAPAVTQLPGRNRIDVTASRSYAGRCDSEPVRTPRPGPPDGAGTGMNRAYRHECAPRARYAANAP